MDLGWTELLVVVAIALLLFGPKELPEVARGLGRTLRRIRRMRQDAERAIGEALREIEREADLEGESPAARPEPTGDRPSASPDQADQPPADKIRATGG